MIPKIMIESAYAFVLHSADCGTILLWINVLFY